MSIRLASPLTLRSLAHSSRSPPRTSTRLFASTRRRALAQQNRIYTPIRNSEDFNNALLLATSQDRPLITLWTASWCSSCAVVAPLLRGLLVDEAVGHDAPTGRSVAFAEIELDSPDIGEVAGRFVVNSVPTLVSFRAGEMQGASRVTDVARLKDAGYLREWIERESESRGGGDGGTGGGKSVFGGLFGTWFGGR